jgi:hypothetical protein
MAESSPSIRDVKKCGRSFRDGPLYNSASKSLPWRHTWGRKGDPAGGPDREKKPFLRVARGRFPETTRINSEKWEKWAGIWGEKAFSYRFLGFLSGFVGRLSVFGQAGRNCFGNQTPKKGLFFSINRRFWDCFWGRQASPIS